MTANFYTLLAAMTERDAQIALLTEWLSTHPASQNERTL